MILVVFCTIGAYVVQSVAQKYTSSTHTALIFTGEPVFAGIFGYILLGEVLGGVKLLGAVVIVLSMLFSEISVGDILNYKKMKVDREAR
jgi:drug/metabolite transporter (DMT)-like permease